MELEQLDGAVDRLVFVLESPAFWNDLNEDQRQNVVRIKKDTVRTRATLVYLGTMISRVAIELFRHGFETKVDFESTDLGDPQRPSNTDKQDGNKSPDARDSVHLQGTRHPRTGDAAEAQATAARPAGRARG